MSHLNVGKPPQTRVLFLLCRGLRTFAATSRRARPRWPPSLYFDLIVTLCWGGPHGKGRSEKLARIRPVAQGKRRRRFDLGDWNASDGIGGSLFTTTRQSDRIH